MEVAEPSQKSIFSNVQLRHGLGDQSNGGRSAKSFSYRRLSGFMGQGNKECPSVLGQKVFMILSNRICSFPLNNSWYVFPTP